MSTHEHAEVVVTVVIPVHGDRGRLAMTLECLSDQDGAPPHEVVVVDNGDNPDITQTVAPHLFVRLLSETEPGSYVARNTGALSARGQFLAFTDSDCLPSRHWLREGTAALVRAPGPSFVGGAVEMFVEHGGTPGPAELWQLGNDLRQEVYVRERGWAATANLFVRLDDFHRVGAFDAQAESGGDREWGERAVRTGLVAVYSDQALVRHPARGTMRQLHRKIARVTRGAVHRDVVHGVPTHPSGHLRVLVPGIRSSWRRSADVSSRLSIRLTYTVTCLWIQEFRVAYALALLVLSRRRSRSQPVAGS